MLVSKEKYKTKEEAIVGFLTEHIFKDLKETFYLSDKLLVNEELMIEENKITEKLFEYSELKFLYDEIQEVGDSFSVDDEILELTIEEAYRNLVAESGDSNLLLSVFKNFRDYYVFPEGLEFLLLTGYKLAKEGYKGEEPFENLEYFEGIGNTVYVKKENVIYGANDFFIPNLPDEIKELVGKKTLNDDILFFCKNSFKDINDMVEVKEEEI